MAAVKLFLSFLSSLSVLSNSVSVGIRSDPYFLCIKGLPEIKYTHINRISLVNKYFQYGLLKVSG